MYITHIGNIDPKKVKHVSRPTIQYNPDGGRSEWFPIEITLSPAVNREELTKLSQLGNFFVDRVEENEIKESWLLYDAWISSVTFSPPEPSRDVIVNIVYRNALLLL